jgi:hypothetical protein
MYVYIFHILLISNRFELCKYMVIKSFEQKFVHGVDEKTLIFYRIEEFR